MLYINGGKWTSHNLIETGIGVMEGGPLGIASAVAKDFAVHYIKEPTHRVYNDYKVQKGLIKNI